MATAKIRVGQTEKIKIEVNDAGEFIEINTGDKRLVAKLTELMKKLKEQLFLLKCLAEKAKLNLALTKLELATTKVDKPMIL